METVIYEKKERIAYITLNRPEKFNAINVDVLDRLEKAWTDFRDDDSLWVAILTGAGRTFCAGADVTSFGQPGWDMNRALPTTYKVWKPIIAALNGYVFGGGFWLVLNCDLRVASEDAEFSLPEPRVGLAVGDAEIFPRYMPSAIAYELLLTGGRISAQRAYQSMIINQVVPADQLLNAATDLAKTICVNAPLAVRAMKQALQRGQEMVYRGVKEEFQSLFDAVKESQDYQEGIRAFKEKRKPNWQAR